MAINCPGQIKWVWFLRQLHSANSLTAPKCPSSPSTPPHLLFLFHCQWSPSSSLRRGARHLAAVGSQSGSATFATPSHQTSPDPAAHAQPRRHQCNFCFTEGTLLEHLHVHLFFRNTGLTKICPGASWNLSPMIFIRTVPSETNWCFSYKYLCTSFQVYGLYLLFSDTGFFYLCFSSVSHQGKRTIFLVFSLFSYVNLHG